MSRVDTSWGPAPLSEIAEVNPSTFIGDLSPDSLVSFVGMSDVSEGGQLLSHHECKMIDVLSGYTRFQDGDVLFAKITPCMENGKGALAEGLINGRGFGSTEFHVLRANADGDAAFIFQVVQDKGYRLKAEQQMTGSAGQRRVPADFFREFEIPIPPLPQQRKIAEILTTVDDLIERTEALIAKHEQVKQGMMHDLFTRGVDENGKLRPPREEAPELYKESELGWIPREWEVKRLVDVASYQTGKAFPSSEYCDEGIPLLRPGNLRSDEYVVWDSKHTICLSKEWQSREPSFLVGQEEIVMNLTAQSLEEDFLGRVCVTPPGKECLLNQRIARFKVVGCKQGYFFWALKSRSFRNQVDSLTQGTKVQHIYNSNLNRMVVGVPLSVDEQKIISDQLFAMRNSIRSELSRLSKLQKSKQALMQDLLTGRVPVVVDG